MLNVRSSTVARSRARPRATTVVGIDLAGVAHRRTGFAALQGLTVTSLAVLGPDEEIVRRTLEAQPEVVTIDAPLFLPRGRRSLEDRGPPHLRDCDRELQRLGIRFLPVSLGPMRGLTRRGMALRHQLEAAGLRVFETYPGAVQVLLGLPRKTESVPRLAQGLRRLGLRGLPAPGAVTHDELDAVSAALAARAVRLGRARLLGAADEGFMAVPWPPKVPLRRQAPPRTSRRRHGPPRSSPPRPGPPRRPAAVARASAAVPPR